jgi:YD repeat-containing protein
MAYGQDTVAQTATVTIKDMDLKNGRQITYHLTNDYMTLNSSGQSVVINQPVGVHRMQKNVANQTEWLLIPANNPSDPSKFIYKGGNLAIVDQATMRKQAYDSWNYDPDAVSVTYFGITGNLNSTVIGASTSTTLSQLRTNQIPSLGTFIGSQKTYLYDSSGREIRVTYAADNTYSTKTYNSFSQVTRERSRDGEVTQYVYDAQGHMTTKKVGLIEQGGSDVQTADYAEYQYEYYPSTHANKGLLKSEKAPLYSSSNPTQHITEYEYNTQGRLTKITGPADTNGGARPVTQFSYTTSGNLASTTDPLNRVTNYSYNAFDQLTATT